MRILTYLLLLAVMTIGGNVASAQTSGKKNTLELKVHITGLKDKDTLLLANYYGDKQYIQDTMYSDASGNVTFKCDTAKMPGIYLVVVPGKKFFEIVLPTKDQQHLSVDTRLDSLVGYMKIKGSPENERFYDYLHFINDKQVAADPIRKGLEAAKKSNNKDSIKLMQGKLEVYDKEVKKYKEDYITKNATDFMAKVFNAMREPDDVADADIPANYATSDSLKRIYRFRHYRAHFWDGMDWTDDRLIYTPVYHNKLKQYLENLTIQHPDSISAACDEVVEKARPSKELFKYTVFYATYTYELSKVMGFDAVFVHMVFKYIETGQAWWYTPTQLKKIIERAHQLDAILIGKVAPDITLTDSAYVTRRLSETKGKYTILVFWEPTCGHCQKEIPKIKTYYDKMKSYGVNVYAVVTENDLDAWKKYIRDHNLNWINVAPIQVDPNVKLTTTYKHTYDVISTPTILVLDENKKIIARRIDAEQAGKTIDHDIEVKTGKKLNNTSDPKKDTGTTTGGTKDPKANTVKSGQKDTGKPKGQ